MNFFKKIKELKNYDKNIADKAQILQQLDAQLQSKTIEVASINEEIKNISQNKALKDAVGLEAELHRRLHQKRTNKINLRKEFFDISIDELEELVNEICPVAEFKRTMLAAEYHRGLS